MSLFPATDLEKYDTPTLLAELRRRREEIDAAIDDFQKDNPAVAAVLAAVAGAWACPVTRLFRRGQSPFVAEPRQCAMVILRDRLGLTYQTIGEIFHRDHGTVMHAVSTHPARMTLPAYALRHAAAIASLNKNQ